MAASDREGLLSISSVTSLLMVLESSRLKDVILCENFKKCTPMSDGQKWISKGTFQSSYLNLSQLHIFNQLHALVCKTKPSKTRPRNLFFRSDLMDFVSQLMENGVVMLLVNRGLATNRNTSSHTPADHWQIQGSCHPVGTWYLRLWIGTREMPTARISTCH